MALLKMSHVQDEPLSPNLRQLYYLEMLITILSLQNQICEKLKMSLKCPEGSRLQSCYHGKLHSPEDWHTHRFSNFRV